MPTFSTKEQVPHMYADVGEAIYRVTLNTTDTPGTGWSTDATLPSMIKSGDPAGGTGETFTADTADTASIPAARQADATAYTTTPPALYADATHPLQMRLVGARAGAEYVIRIAFGCWTDENDSSDNHLGTVRFVGEATTDHRVYPSDSAGNTAGKFILYEFRHRAAQSPIDGQDVLLVQFITATGNYLVPQTIEWFEAPLSNLCAATTATVAAPSFKSHTPAQLPTS